MVTIGIGSAHSGAGKTYFACALIKRLAGMNMPPSCMKCTPHPLYASITDDPEIINEPGKDTALMMEAAAERVLWVHTESTAREETLQTAMEQLAGSEIILIEGNGAIEVLKPDIVIFITGNETHIKPGAQRILALAQIVIADTEMPHRTDAREDAKIFRRDETDDAVTHLIELVGKAF